MNLSTLSGEAERLRRGEVSSVDLTSALLENAHTADGSIGVYLSLFEETALRAASTADEELKQGIHRGPLHGVPLGIKDILSTVEGPTTAQSVAMEPGWGGGQDAVVVRRLREAGAVIMGKTSTMEFACGMPDPSKPFPVPRNPWDLERWAGGSSSGTASGVGAEFFLGGLGTDTAGSIRIPAAFCGVTGFKPTYSVVPKSGCVPLSYSLDHVGPIARSAEDCALILDVIEGSDPSDPTCLGLRGGAQHVAHHARSRPLAGSRIGVVRDRDHLPQGTDEAIVGAFDAACQTLADQGAELVELSLPYYAETRAAAMVVIVSEALAYHRRNLGSRWSDYAKDTRQMVSLGAYVSGADYVEAQRVRTAVSAQMGDLMRQVDLVVTPTASISAPRVEDLATIGLLDKVNCVYWDAVGYPTLSVPIGFATDGMPVGMQIAGRPFDDKRVLEAGMAYQDATEFHLRRPAAGATDNARTRDDN